MLNKSVRKHPETEWSGYVTLHKARLALYLPQYCTCHEKSGDSLKVRESFTTRKEKKAGEG